MRTSEASDLLVAWTTIVAVAASIVGWSYGASVPTGPLTLNNPPVVRPFEAIAIDGSVVSVSDWTGGVTVVNFWATWCGPCRLEIPELVSVDAARPRAARIVGVSLDSDSEAVRRFVRAHGLSYQVVMGTETILGSFPDLTGIPTTFVVDGRAEIVARFLGPVERSALLKAVGDPRGSRRE